MWQRNKWAVEGRLLFDDITKPKAVILVSEFVLLFSIFFFLGGGRLFRAAPVAYGGSQARGPSGVVATSLHHSHSNTGSEPHL